MPTPSTIRPSEYSSTVAACWASAPLPWSDRGKRLVLAEDRAHRAADLSQRAVGVNGVDDRGHQVLITLCRAFEPGQRGVGGGAVTLRAEPEQLLVLLAGHR